MKVHEFAAGNSRDAVPAGPVPELEAALDGLLELDATVKGSGAGGSASRRVGSGSASGCASSWSGPEPSGERRRDRGRRLFGARPGLLLDDEVALDGEDAAAVAEVEQLDQVGVDVELAGSPRTGRRGCRSTAARVRSGRRKVVSKRVIDELVIAGGATLAKTGHGSGTSDGTPVTCPTAPDARASARVPPT